MPLAVPLTVTAMCIHTVYSLGLQSFKTSGSPTYVCACTNEFIQLSKLKVTPCSHQSLLTAHTCSWVHCTIWRRTTGGPTQAEQEDPAPRQSQKTAGEQRENQAWQGIEACLMLPSIPTTECTPHTIWMTLHPWQPASGRQPHRQCSSNSSGSINDILS